jgi:hypothetical protein
MQVGRTHSGKEAGMAVTLDDLDAAIKAGKVPEKDRGFATDLVTKGRIRPLSVKQLHWVGVLFNRAMGKVATKVVGDFSGVYALFQKAKTHLKYPKVTLLTAEGNPLQLYLSGPQSRMPNMVNVTDGAGYGNSTWYGRISPEGTWTPNDRLDTLVLPPILKVLKKLAKDPEGVAAEYGKLTGNCCFCVRKLADARSTDVGYGPVCAKRYGLRWGK